GGGGQVGDERTADHRTRATHVLPPRPSDHLAAVAADSGTRLGGALEVGDPPAHENGVAPADRDVGDFPSRGKTPFIPAHSASKTRVNALMAGIPWPGAGAPLRGGRAEKSIEQ